MATRLHRVTYASSETLGSHHTMEINSYADLQRKEAANSGGGATMFLGAAAAVGAAPGAGNGAGREQMQFEQALLKLKQEQQAQQAMLLQHYQRQQQQLARQHEQQLQERIREYLDHQRRLQEEHRLLERERLDRDRLDQLKKKEKHEQSAVASSEVKQRLQEFVLNKKQREAAAANSASASPPNFRNWSRQHASLDRASPPSTGAAGSQCGHPLLGKYEDDFPLRKTASEPNLKVRSVLKQKVIERRSSPLLRRKDKGPIPLKRRPLTIDGSGSKPDSVEGSPPNGSSLHSSLHSSNGSTPIQEEPGDSPYHPLGQGGNNDLTLYSSPSMPNISLGRPPVPTGSADGKVLNSASEAQVRAMAAARLGMPLTSHVLHASLPFCSPLPVIDGEFTPPTSPGYVQQQMKALEQQGGSPPQHASSSMSPHVLQAMYPPGSIITDAQVAQARLHRNIHRPLGRTQSAPLPLGHPMLQPQGVLINPQLYEQQQQHNLLKQHIRQTVLTRAGSKSQVVEHVEEETEAAVAQEMKDQPEVIDLTDSRKGSADGSAEGSPLARQQREREAFLQQQRDIVTRHMLHVGEGSAFTARQPGGGVRPLSRALSSPLVSLSPPTTAGSPQHGGGEAPTTALAYDSLMLKHQCICGDYSSHPEHGGRLQSIWARLQETGLVGRCDRVRSRKATLEEIQSCHGEAYTLLFGTNPLNRQKLEMSKLAELPIKSFVMLPCGGIGVDSDTTWNELHTASAARMAAGCVTELALKVATGEARNGFAVVRPPGHHAESQQAMGFCFFNSVAIAARQLQQKLKVEKVLIVDWDVHHGNGLQQIFYDDPHVLYVSLHRHDDGNFFPGTGDPQEVGMEDGTGFNINIAWSGALNPPMGDAEYIAAFRTIVMPIARDFDPEVVLVAAGFDAAAGHLAPLGGYQISPACFGYLTKQLMTLAKGKVVLALEGGYDLPSICDCSQECVSALLGDECSPLKEEEVTRKPCAAAVQTLQRTAAIQAPHWPCIKKWVPTVAWSLLEAQQKEKEEVETVTALASLSMAARLQNKPDQPQEEEPMEEDQEK